jgi:NAD(P)H-nitrite reductase large subunit
MPAVGFWTHFMAQSTFSSPRAVCGEKIVCACLRVTAGTLMEALGTGSVQTLKDLKRETGAGDGCMACHRLLRRYLDEHAA